MIGRQVAKIIKDENYRNINIFGRRFKKNNQKNYIINNYIKLYSNCYNYLNIKEILF